MDPVGIVIDLIMGGLDAYAKLSEQDREKVKASLKASRAETHAETMGLAGDLAKLKAEHEALKAARDHHKNEADELRKHNAELVRKLGNEDLLPATSSER